MFRWISQLLAREFGEWRRLDRLRKLETLSDHQLRDLGLRREQLFDFGREAPAEARRERRAEPLYRVGFEPCG